MPYPNRESLPEAVKMMPEHAMMIWMEAFNAAYSQHGEESAFKIAWSAVANAGYAKEGDKWVKHSAEAIKLSYSGANFKSSIAESKGYSWLVRVIEFGKDKNEYTWTSTVLKEYLSSFEGAKVFMLSEAQHSADKHPYGKPTSELVGWIHGAYIGEDGLYGNFKIVANRRGTDLRDTLISSFDSGKKDFLGLSVDLLGKANEDKLVTAISNVTVDIVYEPAAGGNFIKMAASIKKEVTVTEEEKEKLRKEQEDLQKQILAAKQSREDIDKIKTDLDKSKLDLQRLVCATRLDTSLKLSGLPIPVQDKIKSQFKDTLVSDEQITASIKLEKDTLDMVLGETIKGAGYIKVISDDLDNRKKMLDDFFQTGDYDKRPRVQSIKACYINLTGDELVSGVRKDCKRITASMDSTTLSSMLGDSITRKMVEEYKNNAYNQDWRKIVDVVPRPDFRTNRIDRMGGYGNLPAVSQGGAYSALTSPTDEESTYSVSKRGGTEDITLEMIKNDDVGAVRRIPIKLGTSAARTLYEFVFDFIRTNPTIYDNTALFTTGHGNLGTAAFDTAALTARRIAMMSQTELSSGKRIGIMPKYILHPINLTKTIFDIIIVPGNTTPTTTDYNRTLKLEQIEVGTWTDTNDWALVASPSQCPGIEIGFLDGAEDPSLYVQDQETSGMVFTNDKITYKIRHIYGGVVKDFRAFDKSVVT